MHTKFALLHFAETMDQIPVKLPLFRKTPRLLRDWYIEKFNTFQMERLECLGEEGYDLQLPLTASDALTDAERTTRLTRRALRALQEQGVDILLPPPGYPYDFPEEIHLADGKGLFPFFMRLAVEKVLKILGRDLKTAEIFIVDGNRLLTENLLYNLYPHVNFLNLMTDNPADETYRLWADYIFSDTGLNLGVFEKNKALLAEADIIVNTSFPALKADYSYKKGAVYFDLGWDKAQLHELAGKREDILVIDGLRLSAGEAEGSSMPLQLAEAAFYVKSKAYRTLVRRGFRPDLADQVAKELKQLTMSPASLCLKDRPLSNLHYAKFLARAGSGISNIIY